MLFTDIRELKTILDIDQDDTSEDKLLNIIMEWSSAWIEELLNRPGFSYKQRTEYYDGTGTQQLLLKSRPVYGNQTITVSVDETGYYGSATGSFSTNLTYGTDFCLRIDGEDGITSKNGILVRIGNYWPKPSVRQAGLLSPFIGPGFGCIKVVYYGGYLVDNLPAPMRAACCLLAAKMRHVIPIGMEIGGEGYEERSMSYLADKRDYLTSLVRPMIATYRNHKW